MKVIYKCLQQNLAHSFIHSWRPRATADRNPCAPGPGGQVNKENIQCVTGCVYDREQGREGMYR